MKRLCLMILNRYSNSREEVIDLLSKNNYREEVKTIVEDMQGMFDQFINRIGSTINKVAVIWWVY